MVEQRKYERRQVSKSAVLRYRCLAKLGVVKNISRGGAMVAVENSIEIPDHFRLEANIHNGPCRLAWRNANQIGVKFL